MNKLLFILFFFYSLCTEAQQKKESYNALLWRISGNGLTEASYIFGTMHITDKKVFHFTDSLYHNLEQCKGFAAELDISNVFTKYLSNILDESKEEDDENSPAKYLTDSIDETTLEKYKTALEKKFRKPINKIRIKDLDKQKGGWTDDMFRKGEMQTFMDAYLFEIARRQGKWTGGIEDPEDQIGIDEKISIEDKLDALSQDNRNRSEKRSLEWMINTYLKQDLDAIDRSDYLWQGAKDVYLTRRNIKMALRIDSLANIRSTFFAIGAAHIPGNDGVIRLLREKGFTVTPIYSRNKIAPEEYKYKQIELPWVNVPINDSLFVLQMPGKPEAFPLYENIPVDMKFYLDMGYMRAFFTMAVPVSANDKETRDSLMDQLAKRYTVPGKKMIQKEISVNGQAGREMITVSENAEIRLQVFVPGNFIAVNLISSYKPDGLTGEDAEKFFQSFKVTDKPRNDASVKKDRWQQYKFDHLGFEVELPSKYREKAEKGTDVAWKDQTIETIDLIGQVFYGIRVSTVQKGYYSDSDSTLFELIRSNLEGNMKGEIISSRHFLRQGYPAYEAVATGESEGEKIRIRFLCVNKGPRRYFIFTTSGMNAVAEETEKRFFNSFRFLPAKEREWETTKAPDVSFVTWSPSPISYFKEGKPESNEIKFLIYDSSSSIYVYIDKEVVPAYYWTKSDSIFFRSRVNTYYNTDDSLLYCNPVINGKTKGVDLLIKLAGTHNLKKMRVLLNGDTLYSIYAYLTQEMLETHNIRRMFNELKIEHEVKPFDFITRKPAQLLKALQTKDSASFANAKKTLDMVEFKKEDIPLLQEALLYQYQDFDSSYYNNTSQALADLVEDLDSTGSTISFARENYKKLVGEKEYLKPFLIEILSLNETKESYDLLKELMIQSPPLIKEPYYFKNGFRDSLSLSSGLYPELIALSADPGLYDLINELTLDLVDSGRLDVQVIRKHKEVYIKSAKQVLALPEKEKEEKSYYFTALVKLLGKINEPETNELIKKFGDINDRSLKQDVILVLAENNQTPDARDIYTLATTDEFRSSLYEGLKKLKKEKLFPKDYLGQRQLGQSVLFSYASDDDPPESIVFFAERTATFMGKKQKFYLYKVFYGDVDDESCYLGVAGPYSMDSKDLTSSHDVTGVYWDESFDKEKTDEQFKELLLQAEEWLNKQKEEKNKAPGKE